MKKVLGTAAATLALLVMIPIGGAAAEGSWSGKIVDAMPGFNSRTWTDRNNDSVNTQVLNSSCSNWSGSYSSHRFNLYVEPPGWFHQSVGTRTSYCSTVGWGRVAAGNYHWTVDALNGSQYSTNPMNANVTTKY